MIREVSQLTLCREAVAGPTGSKAEAEAFAERWYAAWNGHDLDAILAEYTDDYEFTSPVIKSLRGVESGMLKGKAVIGDHWKAVLAKYPDLRMTPYAVTRGVDALSLCYTVHTDGRSIPAIETFFFDKSGLVSKSIYTMDIP